MLARRIKEILFEFFHFNKQERNGVFVLCLIIVIFLGIRLMLPFTIKNNTEIEIYNSNEINGNSTNLIDTIPNYSTNKLNTNYEKKSSEYFVFDPNTVTHEDALKLGFSEKLASTLINFRNKGGKFFKANDLKKIYGLSPNLYKELEQYILIPQKEFKKDTFNTNKFRSFEKKVFIKELVELNTADSLSIVYIKGIGPSFTKRIIKYRTMLGGFHSLNQLKEVYGMTDSLYYLINSQIKIDANTITKIPINSIDFNTLRKHPYFNFQTAQAIINFRFKHGKLNENDIKQLGVFTEEKLNLILPYLSY